MTTEQVEMFNNIPQRDTPKKSIVTKTRVAITLGLVVGGVAAYFIGPTILGKVQARSILKSTSVS